MRIPSKLFFACSILTLVFSLPAVADQLIPDDLVVTGSMCVGTACINDEDFGFDTLKLKSDTPQIRFQDTSNSAGFPTNDWTMGIEDSPTDTSFFYISDAVADMIVLKLSSGASGGIAIGAGSELEENAISVGAAGTERRIVHVADGIDPTDAVTVGQLNQFQNDIGTQLADLVTDLAAISARIDDLVTRVKNLENP